MSFGGKAHPGSIALMRAKMVPYKGSEMMMFSLVHVGMNSKQ